MQGKRIEYRIGESVGNCFFDGDYRTEKRPGGYRRFCYFKCFCGKRFISTPTDVKSFHTKSCGCIPCGKTKHGKTAKGKISAEWTSYQNMMRRCYDKKLSHYKNYGGRGIFVCKRWRESFVNFYADMGDRPSPKHSLERTNNNRGYSKSNCRWATKKEQASNTRRNLFICYLGNRKTVAQWAQETGIDKSTIAFRFKAGLPLKLVFTKGHLQKLGLR